MLRLLSSLPFIFFFAHSVSEWKIFQVDLWRWRCEDQKRKKGEIGPAWERVKRQRGKCQRAVRGDIGSPDNFAKLLKPPHFYIYSLSISLIDSSLPILHPKLFCHRLFLCFTWLKKKKKGLILGELQRCVSARHVDRNPKNQMLVAGASARTDQRFKLHIGAMWLEICWFDLNIDWV